ncbi:MAG: methyltransferase domain-containing protein [Deltaproteobacteria bacterium]|nr:MAG: methyltransferase domain-containing protein [Deltaproteobacteria bacterium]
MTDVAAARPRSGRIEGELDFLLVSLLSLYLEILLIRWIGTEIRIFAYFANLVLVTCFFGLGIGYATTRVQLRLDHGVWLVALLCLVVHPALAPLGFGRISEAVATRDVLTWTLPTAETAARLLGFARLALLLLVIALAFVPFGRALGDYFEREPRRLRAYSINVAGSLLGIWLFAALSFARLPPLVWFGLFGALLLVALRRAPRVALSAGLGVALILALLATARSGDGDTTWSAYQKLVLRQSGGADGGSYSLEVNNTLYQYVLDLSETRLDRSPKPLPAEERPFYYYNLPYRLHAAPERVLVVGAGTGNDVAAALRSGASHVDAVEIDAAIVEVGRRVHPERPYDDPRVRVVIDDARAFFKRSRAQYDLIVFGLLDSHKLTSNFSNTNLDSYVYTVESLREARALLRPGGAIVMAFQTFYPYIAWRLHDTLAEASGQRPLALYVTPRRSLLEGTGGVVFFSGDRQALAERRAADPALDRALRRYERAMPPALRRANAIGEVSPATDDWPYLYVEGRRIPSLWLSIMGLVAALALFGSRAAGLSLRRIDGQFFFLGAAFLFLETYTITRAHLFFGSTWVVSSVVISAILIMVLVGNAIVATLRPTGLRAWYVALLLTALLAWAVPPDRLLALGAAGATLASAGLAALPLLFAAVVFGSSFTRAANVRYAMSSNLLGALAGGLIQCLSFVTGLGVIALFAVTFYAVSWLFLALRTRRSALA